MKKTGCVLVVVFSVAAIALSTGPPLFAQTETPENLVWQLGEKNQSRNEFVATGRWDPSRCMWSPVACEEYDTDSLTFTTKLDRLGVFPHPRFPIATRNSTQEVTAGAQRAVIEWDDPIGGPEALEINFAYVGGDGADLRLSFPDRVRYLVAGVFPDVTQSGPMTWRFAFNARKGPNRIAIEQTRQGLGYEFDMIRLIRIDHVPPAGKTTPVVHVEAIGDELAHIYWQGMKPEVKVSVAPLRGRRRRDR